MDEEMNVNLQQEIIASLSARFENEPGYSLSVLTDIVIDAIEDVKQARNYPGEYTEQQIERDLYKYKGKIKNIALYDYNKDGVQGQKSHSENSVSRTYEDRNSYFSGILPLSRTR